MIFNNIINKILPKSLNCWVRGKKCMKKITDDLSMFPREKWYKCYCNQINYCVINNNVVYARVFHKQHNIIYDNPSSNTIMVKDCSSRHYENNKTHTFKCDCKDNVGNMFLKTFKLVDNGLLCAFS